MLILLVGTEILLSESERFPAARHRRIRHDKRRTFAISPRRVTPGRQLRSRILDSPSFLAGQPIKVPRVLARFAQFAGRMMFSIGHR
jgi:hypothetical protein